MINTDNATIENNSYITGNKLELEKKSHDQKNYSSARVKNEEANSAVSKNCSSDSFKVVYQKDTDWDAESELTEEMFVELLRRQIEKKKTSAVQRKSRKGVPTRPKHNNVLVQQRSGNKFVFYVNKTCDMLTCICAVCAFIYAAYVIYNTYVRIP